MRSLGRLDKRTAWFTQVADLVRRQRELPAVDALRKRVALLAPLRHPRLGAGDGGLGGSLVVALAGGCRLGRGTLECLALAGMLDRLRLIEGDREASPWRIVVLPHEQADIQAIGGDRKSTRLNSSH